MSALSIVCTEKLPFRFLAQAYARGACLQWQVGLIAAPRREIEPPELSSIKMTLL